MKSLDWKTKRIFGYLACFALTGILSGCGNPNIKPENTPSENITVESPTPQSPFAEINQSILQYEEKYAAQTADATDLRTLANLYGQLGRVKRQRDLLEQSYRLFADEEALIGLKELTVNLAEEDILVQEMAQQLQNNLCTDGYLNEAILLLHSEDWFFTMMPKLNVGHRRYYLNTPDGNTLCFEVGYNENGTSYTSVWLTLENEKVLHLLKQEELVYLLETGLSDGVYHGEFETWLCLSSGGDVYHEKGIFDNGICVGEYTCEVSFGSSSSDLISLWNNRKDFSFTDYFGEFDSFGKTLLTQPSSLPAEQIVYAYDTSQKHYLTLQAEEPSSLIFDYVLLGLKPFPSFTSYEVIEENEAVSSGDIPVQIRIYDSTIEWFDGTVWHSMGSLAEYVAADPFRQENNLSASPVIPTDEDTTNIDIGRGNGSLVTTTKPTTSNKKPVSSTQKPQPSTPPEETQKPVTTPPPAPAPAPTPTPTPTPSPVPTPGTGDGSDIEWSPDFE